MKGCKLEEDKMVRVNFHLTPMILDKVDLFVRLGLTPNRAEYFRHSLMNQITVDWKVFEKMRIVEGRE